MINNTMPSLDQLSFSEKYANYMVSKRKAHIEASIIGWILIILICLVFFLSLESPAKRIFHTTVVLKYVGYVVLIPFVGAAVLFQNWIEKKLIRYHYSKIIQHLKRS